MVGQETIKRASRPRHSRRLFSSRREPEPFLLSFDPEILDEDDSLLDFSPEFEDDDSDEPSALLALLSRSIMEPQADDSEEVRAVLRRLASTVSDSRPDLDRASWFEESGRANMRLKVSILASGQRLETYSNGSTVTKDVLGRVCEVRSRFGDCLTFQYGAYGALEHFERLDYKGAVHSSGTRDRHGVTVRNAEGRVRAAGESMTVDPWGCFYLHTFDGQYFCLDLVAGIHSERRRIVTAYGAVDYVTAAFANDGFRMATLYCRSDENRRGARRLPVFRFYGRDGTFVEFESEEALRCHSPSRAGLPGSRPPHSSWLKRPQANTAWASVHEYLCRVS